MLEGNFARVKFGYTGHRLEERTGHWSALHRQLDPRAGRWTQRDPLGMVDGLNRYAYTRNAPTTYMDSLGLAIEAVGARAQAALELVSRSPVTATIVNRIKKDPCKLVQVIVTDVIPPGIPNDALAETLSGPETRKEWRNCCPRRASDGKDEPLVIPMYIYASRFDFKDDRGQFTLGHDLGLQNWISIRVAHELWHADTLYGSNEPGTPDGGFALGESFYGWLLRQAR